MNDKIQELLAPISKAHPAGEWSEEAEAAIADLEEMIVEQEVRTVQKSDKGEREVITYKPPEWSKVSQAAEGILRKQCKHLRAAVVYALAATELRGFQGLGDGLHLLAGLIEAKDFWEKMFPALESTDPFSARTVILEDLATSGLEGDNPYRLVARVQFLPIVKAPSQEDGFSYAEVEAARNPAASALGTGKAPPKIEEVEATWQAASPDQLREVASQIQYAIQGLERMVSAYSAKTGKKNALNLKPLQEVLRRIAAMMAKRGEADGGGQTTDKAEGSGEGSGELEETDAKKGTTDVLAVIRNRTDALRALKAAREYYSRREPNSPALLLLDLAQELNDKNFIELMDRLPPVSIKHLKTAFPASANAAPSATPATQPGVHRDISLDIQTRPEALRALAAVRSHLGNAEPASPVPMLVDLAHNVSGKPFDQFLSGLPPEAVEQLKVIFKKREAPLPKAAEKK